MPKKRNLRTFQDVLMLSTKDLVSYLYAYVPNIDVPMDNPDGMRRAGQAMSHMANIFVYFSELDAYAGTLKRAYKWEMEDAADSLDRKEKRRKYEDMVDKEKIIENAGKALETQYRAINRALTVWMESERDRYMPDGIAPKKRK